MLQKNIDIYTFTDLVNGYITPKTVQVSIVTAIIKK